MSAHVHTEERSVDALFAGSMASLRELLDADRATLFLVRWGGAEARIVCSFVCFIASQHTLKSA